MRNIEHGKMKKEHNAVGGGAHMLMACLVLQTVMILSYARLSSVRILYIALISYALPCYTTLNLQLKIRKM